MKARVLLLLVGGMLLLWGCVPQKPLPAYQTVDEDGWDRSRALVFPAREDHTPWRTLRVRTSAAYPFTRLALELRHDTLCDTVFVDIPPAVGTTLTQNVAPLPRPIDKAVKVRYVMGTEILPGVCEVGLE